MSSDKRPRSWLDTEGADRMDAVGQYRLALAWLRHRADRNDISEQIRLIVIYTEGRRKGRKGPRRNWKRRAYWVRRLKKLARTGNSAAQFEFGWGCVFGQGFRQNKLRAKFWLVRAADNGHAESQTILHSWCREFGLGEERGRAWFLRAVRSGYADALWEHSFEFFTEDGRPLPKAIGLIREAARKGSPPAIEWLEERPDFR